MKLFGKSDKTTSVATPPPTQPSTPPPDAPPAEPPAASAPPPAAPLEPPPAPKPEEKPSLTQLLTELRNGLQLALKVMVGSRVSESELVRLQTENAFEETRTGKATPELLERGTKQLKACADFLANHTPTRRENLVAVRTAASQAAKRLEALTA